MSGSYAEFLERKADVTTFDGIEGAQLQESLFPFQRDLVAWALRRGRAALFADTGLGKTLMQCEWSRIISERGRVLILAPLAVAEQTVAEAARFGITVAYLREDDGQTPITITNYELLHRFDPDDFAGIVLDESSILKSYDGATRTAIIEAFAETPYRLACTATPAPNDFTELGNHAQFLGVKTRQEMLAEFFAHDGGSTQDWRIKGHAETAFWSWVCSWGAMVKRPSDLGYDDAGFALPELRMHEHVIRVEHEQFHAEGLLFAPTARTLDAQRATRRATVETRVQEAARLAQGRDSVIVWCELNREADLVTEAIEGAVQVAGADSPEDKAARLLAFAAGKIRVLVSKPSIAGFGMNFQRCHRMIFLGASHSYEGTYQAIRRCWRFGQEKPVDVHVIRAENEDAIMANYRRKEADAERLSESMVGHMRETMRAEISSARREWRGYSPTAPMKVPKWIGKGVRMKVLAEHVADRFALYHGDCLEVVRGLADESVGYSIFSPPFASLYTYSDSPRDMGNCDSHAEFYEHFRFLVPELYRVTKPGRLLSFHCMLLPTSKTRDGYIGLTDFRGNLIRAFQECGWIHHSEVVIWKDPVTAMQRTKALGLLHKQIKKDSCMSRQGIPDYLITMRKPGDNPEPVSHTAAEFPVQVWQRYASPVWMDINPSDTLQYRSAREHADERHICPLQLEVIRRAMRLWSNPGDVVLSPFSGIGSEGYVALQMGRRFVGAELKASYFEQAHRNLLAAERDQAPLFADQITDETEPAEAEATA